MNNRGNGHPDEITEKARDLYLAGKNVREIADELHIPLSTIKSWKVKKGWEVTRSIELVAAEQKLSEQRINWIAEKRNEAFGIYEIAHNRALAELTKTDAQGNYTLPFRSAEGAISSIDTAIEGKFSLVKETLPYRMMEFLLGLFIEARDRVMTTDKSFRADTANQLTRQYIDAIQGFSRVWANGGDKVLEKLLSNKMSNINV